MGRRSPDERDNESTSSSSSSSTSSASTVVSCGQIVGARKNKVSTASSSSASGEMIGGATMPRVRNGDRTQERGKGTANPEYDFGDDRKKAAVGKKASACVCCSACKPNRGTI